MNIPKEAIEAAVKAISECSVMRFDGFWSRKDLEPEDRKYALLEARAALEAAAPFLAREARAAEVDELAEDMQYILPATYAGREVWQPIVIALQERAAVIRAGEV